MAIPLALGIAAGCALAPRIAHGEEISASGAVGAGMFGSKPASSIELGVDIGGEAYAVGFGGRASFVAGDGLRRQEWDSPSEWAGILRYGVAHVASNDERRAGSAALGTLGGVSLGHGVLVDNYTAGLNVDRGHTGAHFLGRVDRWSAEALIDDVVAPRIGGLRAAWRASERLEVGVQVAGDASAPTIATSGTVGERLVAGAALDGEFALGRTGDTLRGALYGDLVHLFGLGVGAHLGARGDLFTEDERARISLLGEVRAGSSEYLPGWIGPLYERSRRHMVAAGQAMDSMPLVGQRQVAEAGGLGGVSVKGGLRARAEAIGSADLTYAIRRGVSDVASLRLSAPFAAKWQAAVWAAAELLGTTAEAFAVASELRVRLPHGLFVRGEVARLYRQDTAMTAAAGSLVPVFSAQVSVGSVFGESATE